MTVFALIHGGQHGGWCWDAVRKELADRGFSSVAPDLPIDDDAAGAREWAQAVADELGDTDEPVIAVAHSMGGMALPVLATLRPVERMVFVAAVVPEPRLPFAEYLATADGQDAVLMPMVEADPEVEERGGITWADARAYYYPDCDEVQARAAWERLRHNSFTVFVGDPALEAWPDVPSTSVVMADDRCLNPVWQKRRAATIGSVVIERPGGHSPFMYAPDEVADLLVSLVR